MNAIFWFGNVKGRDRSEDIWKVNIRLHLREMG
jgi:hypothetical protein